MSEQNFSKIDEIAAAGLKRPDILLQHVDGWYARVRLQRGVTSGCSHCKAFFIEKGVKPGYVFRAYAAESDEAGKVLSEAVEAVFTVSPPARKGSQDIDWKSEYVRMVRQTLDALLLEKSGAEAPEDYRPLTANE